MSGVYEADIYLLVPPIDTPNSPHSLTITDSLEIPVPETVESSQEEVAKSDFTTIVFFSIRNKNFNPEEEDTLAVPKKMSGVYEADIYLDARPTYPTDWYSKLAALSHHHHLAWDAGTGNGQAAIGIAEHYDRVVATDLSETMIKLGKPNPKVTYHHTPSSMTEDEIVDLIGGENSVDLITVATAVHWFDLQKFYAIVNRLLRKPGGIIAVWSYNTDMVVSPEFDSVMTRFNNKTVPYCKFPESQYFLDGYKTLPFPFKSVGLGLEGKPIELEMKKTVSFEGFLRMLKSWSAVGAAKEKGVDLLEENVVKELETAWGGSELVRTIVYKTFMLAGTVKT
ncbi:hypothetical protein AALP_AA7G052200 [Arabis alpina]|uniref:Methyltransferase type 11 domain-containing protein n=1 Tax=Arabis alpina TaxID=50452 RepID=A0A087GG11_ARAAL|nr:hypothetical protein AALP_AA7G052200 [Arabis alpina]